MCEAFAKGCGGTVVLDFEPRPGIAVIHGMAFRQRRIMQFAGDWFEIDHGYLGRGDYHRVTHKALWTDGAGAPDHERLAHFKLALRPWGKRSGDVLLAAQTDAAYEMDGTTRDKWVSDASRAVRRCSKRHALIRYKPIGQHRLQPPLAKILPMIWALVTHTSSAALEALAAGVPAIVTNQRFPAALLGTTFENIETPNMPSAEARLDLFARLAAQQWNLDEMRSGKCWEALHGNR